MLDFLYANFATIFLIVGLTLKLFRRGKTYHRNVDSLWITIVSIAVLIVSTALEVWASEDITRYYWRILFSAIGYTVRPIAAMGFLLVIVGRTDKAWIYWIPAIINGIIMFSAFVSPLPFWFSKDLYSYHQGPLWYSTVVVSLLYSAAIIVVTLKKYGRAASTESLVIYLCVATCVVAAVLDFHHSSYRLNEAIMISAVFYYMFIRSQDNCHDILTDLRNRHSFEEDCEYYDPRITAFAMIDMNGLKNVNDSEGHQAGDKALTAIANNLTRRSSSTAIPYRMGGDEFAILFLGESEEEINTRLLAIRHGVEDAGYSVACGYATRSEGENLHELYTRADHNMYADKALYYSSSTHDRRRRNIPNANPGGST